MVLPIRQLSNIIVARNYSIHNKYMLEIINVIILYYNQPVTINV